MSRDLMIALDLRASHAKRRKEKMIHPVKTHFPCEVTEVQRAELREEG